MLKTLKHSKFKKNNFISFHDGTTPEIKKIGRSTDGGGSGLKFFKITILTWNHGLITIL